MKPFKKKENFLEEKLDGKDSKRGVNKYRKPEMRKLDQSEKEKYPLFN